MNHRSTLVKLVSSASLAFSLSLPSAFNSRDDGSQAQAADQAKHDSHTVDRVVESELTKFVKTPATKISTPVQTSGTSEVRPQAKGAPVKSEPAKPQDGLDPAFDKDDIRASDVWQNTPGKDVFFECALMAVANCDKGRENLAKMIYRLDEHKYVIRFPKQTDVGVTDDQIEHSNLQNRATWASILELAFDQNFDVDDMLNQLRTAGRPAIGLALIALTETNAAAFRPDQYGVVDTSQLIAAAALKKLPIVVSLKHRKEVKDTPMLRNSIALALTNYDAKKDVATLQGCFESELTAKDEGLEQVNRNTYRMPVKLFPKYIRFVAYSEAL